MFTRFHRFTTILLVILLFGATSGVSYAQDESPDMVEYKVKAGFIFNFLRFISWPDQNGLSSDPWRIGVIGNSKVMRTMRQALDGKTVAGRPVEVSGLSSDLDLALLCHVVFVVSDFSDSSEKLTANLKDFPVLVVGESKDFARKHGIIGFVIRKNNLRLEINPTRARNAGLIVSGKLASLAELVKDEK